jgi:hypothetical protein
MYWSIATVTAWTNGTNSPAGAMRWIEFIREARERQKGEEYAARSCYMAPSPEFSLDFGKAMKRSFWPGTHLGPSPF